MNKRLLRSRRPGQSIVLIALLLVVLFGMVGLAVDVGNIYAQQRSAVRAADAASISGMSTLLETNSDEGVDTAIRNSLKSNKIEIADAEQGVGQTSGNRVLKAQYLKPDGNFLCFVGKCGNVNLKNEVAYIQINIDGFDNTYFARVVGQQTLPVHAQSFASKCSPTSGVYPIAIDSSFLDERGFMPPTNQAEMANYYLYNDELYHNKYQRRIYQKQDVDTPGGFGYFRWTDDPSSGSANYTAAMFAGDGNIDQGFKEAKWPTGSALDPEPAGYPLRPGQLNANDGDWILANTGVMTNLKPYIDELIKNRTRVILPIINGSAGSGSTAAYHVQRLGAFLLRGYGKDHIHPNTFYFDMVYVGDASAVACNITNIPRTSNLSVTGNVFVRPKYRVPGSNLPVAYTVVLDTSGSMSWNFAGEAKDGNGSTLQCGSTSDPAREAKRLHDAPKCRATPIPVWSPESERRITIAKKAIKSFIDLMEPIDAMQIVGFTARTDGSGVGATTNVYEYGTDAGKATLKQAVDDAGKTNGEANLTAGGTPSATGLRMARQLVAGAPKKSTNGVDFRKVTLFLTDGVANYFLKQNNPGGFGWYNNGHDNPSCANSPNIDEDASCQTGYTDTNPPVARPVLAMALEARELKKTNTIYVIALAGVKATGLATEVAQDSVKPWYSEAVQAAQVKPIFDAIHADTKGAACTVVDNTGFTGTIDGAHTVTDPGARAGFGLPADTSVYGYVYLQDAYGNNVKAPAPITKLNGQLGFTFADVTPGTYQVKAFVAYKGDDLPAPVSRSYDWILFPNLSHGTSMSVPVSGSQTLNNVVTLPQLYLDLQGHVCP